MLGVQGRGACVRACVRAGIWNARLGYFSLLHSGAAAASERASERVLGGEGVLHV